MSKTKICFACQECGHDSPKWLGRCPGCGAWNSMGEEVVAKPAAKAAGRLLPPDRPRPITTVDTSGLPRINTGVAEFDRVLGGGIVPGSLVLIGGDPGIGYLYSFEILIINHSKTNNVKESSGFYACVQDTQTVDGVIYG